MTDPVDEIEYQNTKENGNISLKEALDSLHCHLCDKKIKTKWYLKIHMETFHGPNEKRPWSNTANKENLHKCFFCDKKFSQKRSLKLHVKKVHKGKGEKSKSPIKNEQSIEVSEKSLDEKAITMPIQFAPNIDIGNIFPKPVIAYFIWSPENFQ